METGIKVKDAVEIMTKAQALGFLSARIGTTLHLYTADVREEMEKTLLKKARRTGEKVRFADKEIWFTHEAIVDLSKSGSAMYTWAIDGNRVKCNIVRHTRVVGPLGDLTDVSKEIVGVGFFSE